MLHAKWEKDSKHKHSSVTGAAMEDTGNGPPVLGLPVLSWLTQASLPQSTTVFPGPWPQVHPGWCNGWFFCVQVGAGFSEFGEPSFLSNCCWFISAPFPTVVLLVDTAYHNKCHTCVHFSSLSHVGSPCGLGTDYTSHFTAEEI